VRASVSVAAPEAAANPLDPGGAGGRHARPEDHACVVKATDGGVIPIAVLAPGATREGGATHGFAWPCASGCGIVHACLLHCLP
jgi:hypothetical protein